MAPSLLLTDPLIPFGFGQQPPRRGTRVGAFPRLPAPRPDLGGQAGAKAPVQTAPDGLFRASSEGRSLR